MVRSNKLLHKVQHLFAVGGSPCGIRTFIQAIHDNVNGNLTREFEHVFETFCQGGLTGLLGAITMGGVQFMEDAPAKVRVVTELEDKRLQQAAKITLGAIFEIEIIIGGQRQRDFSYVLDVFNYRGAYRQLEFCK